MRFIVADWGKARFRGYLIENETVLDQISSNEGVSTLQKRSASRCVPASMRAMARDRARRAGAPRRHGGKPRGLARGTVCHLPSGPAEIAQALVPVDLENGRKG